jgi:hypothetical protein
MLELLLDMLREALMCTRIIPAIFITLISFLMGQVLVNYAIC